MLKLAALLTLLAGAANAQSYLVYSSQAACQARSQSQCAALGCDGVQTIYWWPCQVLTAKQSTGGAAGSGGTTAVRIIPGDPYFDATTTNQVATSPTGLTTAEQSAVQTVGQLTTALPFVLTTAQLKARVPQSVITAIQNNATLAPLLAQVVAQGYIDLTSAQANSLLSGALADGIITQAQFQTATAWVAVLSAP